MNEIDALIRGKTGSNRADVAEVCRLVLEHPDLFFDVLHIVGTPEAEKSCNVAHAREVLGLEFRGDLEQYR